MNKAFYKLVLEKLTGKDKNTSSNGWSVNIRLLC